VVASGETEGHTALKPDPAGYLRAAAELAVSPDRALVIGDRPDADGLAASRAGMGFRRV
jgi:HAD superfamily hydrolase (TIGR01549 family)